MRSALRIVSENQQLWQLEQVFILWALLFVRCLGDLALFVSRNDKCAKCFSKEMGDKNQFMII